MSNQYSFSGTGSYKNESVLGSAVLVEDGIVWDEEEMEVSLNYTDNQDVTLSANNNENYLTADEGSDDSQFFSVLETSHQGILNDFGDIVVDCNNSNVPDTEERTTVQNNICTIGGQPDIYRIEGSDELYAFEVAYDQDGNMQRFRYRLRPNASGEYESILDSVELLPLEDEPDNVNSPKTVQPNSTENGELQVQETVFIKQEIDMSNGTDSSEESNDELHVNEDETALSFEEQMEPEINMDTKTGIIEQSLLSMNKIEIEKTASYEKLIFNRSNQGATNNIPNDLEENASNQSNSNILLNRYKFVVPQQSAQPAEKSVQKIDETISTIRTEQDTTSNAKDDEIPFIPTDENSQNSVDSHITEHSDHDTRNIEYLAELNETESDADEYQIVDGLHITADTESQDENARILESLIQRESPMQHQILKIQQQVPILQNVKDLKATKLIHKKPGPGKGFTYYVVKHPEKENVAAIATQSLANKVIRTNPRSVLKSSYPYLELKKEKEVPQVQKIDRRFPRNKEAMQARVLQNFIARTTILHAPVRQQRLPRKQTIKPVERADEEIVVQEVVISSNGFIETTEDGVVKSKVPLKPTEVLLLCDTDEEYDPKNEHKKKKLKKQKSKVTEIVISDSDDDDDDDDETAIVQIDLSAESDDASEQKQSDTVKNAKKTVHRSSVSESHSENEETRNIRMDESVSNLKKKRGRPPKRANDDSSTTTDESSSSKRLRRNTKDSSDSNDSSESKSEGQSTIDSVVQSIKTKWKCTKCPKTFPSQGSLKSHMQYHNFHEPNKNTRPTTTKQEPPKTSSAEINKYVCEKCGDAFKNSILLSRHSKNHIDSKNFECGMCKKIFSDKAQLIYHKRTHIKEQMFKTTTLPKHSPKSTNTVKSKMSIKDNHLKCNYCTKIFSSLTLLNAHARTHKCFTCTNCAATFLSKLVLEDHVRQSCVKQAKPQNCSRLSYVTRKSFMVEPKRASKRLSLRKSGGNATNTSIVKKSETSSSSESTQAITVSSPRLQCDTCKTPFKTHAALYKHKVIIHGFNTPDKSLIKANASIKKSLRKTTPIRGGVPATGRLRSAYANLKTKLGK